MEGDGRVRGRERKSDREEGEKKQRKSAYTPVNYCLACLTRFMRVRSVSITGLKELKTTYIETKAITRLPNKTANHLG